MAKKSTKTLEHLKHTKEIQEIIVERKLNYKEACSQLGLDYSVHRQCMQHNSPYSIAMNMTKTPEGIKVIKNRINRRGLKIIKESQKAFENAIVHYELKRNKCHETTCENKKEHYFTHKDISKAVIIVGVATLTIGILLGIYLR